jgi:hypothetical protein
MTKKGMLQSVRRTIARLYTLQEKFLKDDTTVYIEGEIRKLKTIEERLINEIKKQDLDDLNRRKASKLST